MAKIPIYIVTGFLGGGKTTFLKNFLNENYGRLKIGIIQNEFAAGNVDGAELKRGEQDFEMLEINKGSVFCVCLLNDFSRSLAAFIEKHTPDLIFLEASGLSDPIAVAELFQGPVLGKLVYLQYIWCIVDASTFERAGMMMPRVERQVRIADKVLINKTDLHPEPLQPLREKIRYWNPFCEIEETSYCRISFSGILKPGKNPPVSVSRKTDHSTLEPFGRPDIGSVVLKTTSPIGKKELELFLEEALPMTYRIKGTVKLDNDNFIAIQSVMGKLQLSNLGKLFQPTELIAIGPGINSANFGRRFHAYRKGRMRDEG
jgi:G3E family GTPase